MSSRATDYRRNPRHPQLLQQRLGIWSIGRDSEPPHTRYQGQERPRPPHTIVRLHAERHGPWPRDPPRIQSHANDQVRRRHSPDCCYIYRVCTKAILRKLYRPDFLAPFQLGVGYPGYTEPILHCLQQVSDNAIPHHFTLLTLTDISSAFGSLGRRTIRLGVRRHCPIILDFYDWVYGSSSHLIVRTDDCAAIIESAQGQRQGHALGTFFFSVGARDYFQSVVDERGPECLVLTYLDDMPNPSRETGIVDKVNDILLPHNSSLKLNTAKCGFQTLDDIQQHGIRLLGSVDGHAEADIGLITKSAAQLRSSLSALQRLPSQHALLILRVCLMPRLGHLLRTTKPEWTKEAWKSADNLIKAAVASIRWSGG